MKLTEWFPSSVKPVRPGVYRVKGQRGGCLPGYAYFDGSRWGYSMTTVDEAVGKIAKHHRLAYQNKQWRGLAEKP